MSDEFAIFARFHAIAGQEQALAVELADTVARTAAEPGCAFIRAYASLRDPRLFFIHSRWIDEAAFDVHAALPATAAFVARAERLIDHAFDVTRARVLGGQA